jgi:hypothetical protein
MKNPSQAKNPITKITQILQRTDGSEARITAELVHGPDCKEHLSLYVHRRNAADEQWQLCSDRPHSDWLEMSVGDYIKEGRSEMLQTVTIAEILKASSLLGKDLDEQVAAGAVTEGPSRS